MFLNPLFNIALAFVSLAIAALSGTDNWLVMLPCVFFILLFFISLFRPVTTRVLLPYRIEPKPRAQLVKLTAGRLRAISASRSPFAANQGGAHDLSHTSA